MSVFLEYFTAMVMGFVFIMPIIIAAIRKHRNLIPIAIVNIIFGLTVVGYIIAFIWSFSSNIKVERGQAKITDLTILIFAVVFFILSFAYCIYVSEKILEKVGITNSAFYEDYYISNNLRWIIDEF